MSSWTYITGTITVSPMGRTQHEKTYILNTVLDHLPRVTGSEGDMDIYVNQKNGTNSSSSADEFGYCTNNLEDGNHRFVAAMWLKGKGEMDRVHCLYSGRKDLLDYLTGETDELPLE